MARLARILQYYVMWAHLFSQGPALIAEFANSRSALGARSDDPPGIVDHPTTFKDELYEEANEVQVQNFPFGTEEPDLPIEFEHEPHLGFDFGYAGAEFEDEFPQTDPDNPENEFPKVLKAFSWPVRIRGRYTRDKYTDNTCMGALVHRRIVMTICACVNSYYYSNEAYSPESWIPERFLVPRTSDEDWDLRAPHLVAGIGSWEGYRFRDGRNFYWAEVSKEIFPVQDCSTAVNARRNRRNEKDETLQYVTVAFLLLKADFHHPADLFEDVNDPDRPHGYVYGSYTPYFNFLAMDTSGQTHYKLGGKYRHNLMAYDQQLCNAYGRVMEVTESGSNRGTGKVAPLEVLLLSTKWEQSFYAQRFSFKGVVSQIPNRREHLHYCNYTKEFSDYKKAKKAILTNPRNDVHDKKWGLAMTEFYEHKFEERAACMHWLEGTLCQAPPGSPIIYRYNERTYLFGLTITKPRTENSEEPTQAMMIFVLDLTNRYQKKVKDILRDMINWLNRGRDRTTKPTEGPFEEDERKLLSIGGNLDPDLVPDMMRILEENNLLAKSKTGSIRRKPGFVAVALVVATCIRITV